MYEVAKTNISEMGFADRVDVRFGDAREVLFQIAAENSDDPEIFDAVFIHAAKSHYREFWDLAMPLCKQDAMVICDNVLMKGMTASDEYDPGRRYKTSIRKMREVQKVHHSHRIRGDMRAAGRRRRIDKHYRQEMYIHRRKEAI